MRILASNIGRSLGYDVAIIIMIIHKYANDNYI